MVEILQTSRRVDTDEQSDSRSDLELIDAVNEGDSSAFDVLYLRHRDWVVNLAFRFTRDRDLALDHLQVVGCHPGSEVPDGPAVSALLVHPRMPRPERVFRTVQNSWHPPEWGEDGGWMRLFRNARKWLG